MQSNVGNMPRNGDIITVRIDEVDLPNRVVHVVDRYRGRFSATFRSAGSLLQIPRIGEYWTIRRVNFEWYLKDQVPDPSSPRNLDGVEAGDLVIDVPGNIYLNPGDGGNVLINGEALGANASDISITDEGNYFDSTDVEGALQELGAGGGGGGVTDHGALTGLGDDDHPQYLTNARGDARYWPLSTDLATQAELDAHVADTSSAHTAQGIDIVDSGGHLAATNVEDALAEIATDTETNATAISDHLSDTTDAHPASALTNTPAGNISATTVQGAINELDSEKLSTAAAASTYQPLDSDLTTIAGLTATTDNFIQAKAGAWASRTVSQVVTDLVTGGLLTSATAASTYAPLASPNFSGTPTIGGNSIWHAGNDGASSGLDADLLDGQHGSYYATATGLSDHLSDTVDAHDASAISNVPAGNIAATDVQSAINELDSEKQPTISAGGLNIDRLDIDGGTDIGAALADVDLIIVDDGAGGTNRKSAMSRVWTYISGKITGAASTILTSTLTASRVLVSDGSGNVAASSVTSTELGYVGGVTSAIQTQIDNKQPLDSDLTTIAGLTATSDSFMQAKAGAWAARTVAQVVSDLNAGGLALTSALSSYLTTAAAASTYAPLASPALTGTPTAPTVAIGAGTNIATIGAVNTALGAYLTTSAAAAAYQPLDSDLTTIAGLTATTDNFLQAKAGAWASRTVSQVVTDLVAGGLLTSSTAASTYQPLDSDLTTIASLTATTNNIIQSSGSAWASRTPAQVAATLPAASISGFDTQVRTSRMSDLTLPNAAVPMNSQKFTGLAAGSANGDSLRYEQLFTTGTLNLLGDLTVPGTVISQHASAPRYEVRVTGDSYARARLGYGPNPFLSFGPGSGLSDWYMNRTAADEVTISAGDVLRHDTMAENNNSTAVATTAYVDRATGNASSARPACSLYRTTSFSHNSSGNYLAVTWDGEHFDNNSMHSTSSNTDRITAVTPGYYQVDVLIEWDGDTTGERFTRILKNGTFHVGRASNAPTGANGGSHTPSGLVWLDAGDYLTVEVWQNSGGTRSIGAGAGTLGASFFSAAWVGGTGAAWGNAAARVTKSGAQSITTSSDTLLTWDTETLDSDSIHSTSVNTGRITIVTPGTYAIGAFVEWATNATGGRQAYIRLNGTTIIARDARPATSTTYFPSCSPATLYPLNAGDYLEVFVYQDSGGSLDVNSSSAFWASRVGYQTNPNYLDPVLLHDHARPQWSATATRTTSFVVPQNAKMLFVQLTNLGHANATGIWDMHIHLGTTSGGDDLFSQGGLNGWVGAGAGTGCMYPLNGAYSIPVTAAMRGATLYLTSYAPTGNYYLSGDIKVNAM